jgi:uncharacterized damage-inducible protein DinB
MPLSSSIVTRLEYQHKSLLELIDNLGDEDIRRQVIAGKWSIFENIVHLQTYQHAFLQRMKQIQTDKNPAFARYTAEADPLFFDNCSRTTRDIIQDMITTRRIIAAYVLALKEDGLKREGSHPVFGSMDIAHWMNFFLLHEAHHLFTIFKLTAEVKKASGEAATS